MGRERHQRRRRHQGPRQQRPGRCGLGSGRHVAGLQNILLGWQTATVYKPVKLEATPRSRLAVALLKGETPTADQELDDGTPYIQVTPQLVGPDEVK